MKIDQKTIERCWDNLCSDGKMPDRVDKILALPEAKRVDAVLGFAKILYLAGVENGLVIAKAIYGNDDDCQT